MSKVRVVGSPIRRNAVNTTHKQMQAWLLRFNGCMFTEEDWLHFLSSAEKFAQKLNGRLVQGKPSPNRIALSISDEVIQLNNQNLNTMADGLELQMDVIVIKSEYSRQMDLPEPYLPFKNEAEPSEDKEGGEV